MFDIGFAELIIVSIVGLLILGPERLPGAIRTASLWLGRLRRSFNSIRAEIERELNTEEIKQDLHNEAVMQSLKDAEADLRRGLDTPYSLDDVAGASEDSENKIAAPTADEPTRNP